MKTINWLVRIRNKQFWVSVIPAIALVIQAATAERGLEQLVPDRGLLTVGRTVGAGHFHQIEVPEQLLPMIQRWLSVTYGPDDD